MSQNELALQFFSAGLFDPRISDQALACIDMMDFDRKQFVRDKIAGNGESYKKQQLAVEAAAVVKAKKEFPEAEGESRVTKEARTRAANASVPG